MRIILALHAEDSLQQTNSEHSFFLCDLWAFALRWKGADSPGGITFTTPHPCKEPPPLFCNPSSPNTKSHYKWQPPPSQYLQPQSWTHKLFYPPPKEHHRKTVVTHSLPTRSILAHVLIYPLQTTPGLHHGICANRVTAVCNTLPCMVFYQPKTRFLTVSRHVRGCLFPVLPGKQGTAALSCPYQGQQYISLAWINF